MSTDQCLLILGPATWQVRPFQSQGYISRAAVAFLRSLTVIQFGKVAAKWELTSVL